MAFPVVKPYSAVDPITSLTFAPPGALFHPPRVNLGPAFSNYTLNFFLTNTSTPQNVYQDGALTVPFSPTGVVTADPFGRFPAIYLDNTVAYKVVLQDTGGNPIRTRDPYNPAMATTGQAQIVASQGMVINSAGEVTITEAAAGGSGIALSLTAGFGGALKIQGNAPGIPIIVLDGTVTTGAQTATFAATNMPPNANLQNLLTLTAAPSGATYTGGTLTANFAGISGTTYTVVLSTGQVILGCTLTNGSTAFTCPSTNITGSPTTSITASFSTGVVGWLPLKCDGVTYYTPLFHASAFSPYVFKGFTYLGQTINTTTVTFNSDGTVTLTGTGATATPPLYFSPPAPGTGALTWIGITQTSGLSGVSFNTPYGATVAPSGGTYTGGTLTSAFLGTTLSTYSIILSTGQLITGCTFTNGSTTFTTPSTSINGTPTSIFFVVMAPEAVTAYQQIDGGLVIEANAAATITGTYQLSTSVTGSPVVASGTITLFNGNGATGNSWSGAPNLVLADNGTVTLNGAAASNWSFPTNAGQGANYWINITRTGGTSGVNFTAAQGSFTNITSSGLTIGLTGAVGGNTASGTYQISNNSAGTAIVAQGSITLTVAAGPTGNSWSGNTTLVLNGDGTVTLGGSSAANWYSPTTASVGSLYWIDITKTGGTPNFTAAQGAFTNITNSGLTIDLTNVVGSYTVTGTYQISPNSSGSPVVANGSISLTKNAGASTRTHSTHGSGTETIPIGATSVTIESFGATGSGGAGSGTGCGVSGGGGGGAGGYAKTVLSLTSANWGQTISWTVGTGGPPSAQAGTASTVSSGTFSLTTMTANGGAGGANGPAGAGGVGGTASGGNTTNTTGGAGAAGNNSGGGAGGNGVSGTNGSGSNGGKGGFGAGNAGKTGQDGTIVFKFS